MSRNQARILCDQRFLWLSNRLIKDHHLSFLGRELCFLTHYFLRELPIIIANSLELTHQASLISTVARYKGRLTDLVYLEALEALSL